MAWKKKSDYTRNMFNQLQDTFELVEKLQKEIKSVKESHREEIIELKIKHSRRESEIEWSYRKKLREKKETYENEIYYVNAHNERALKEQNKRLTDEIKTLKMLITLRESEISWLHEENAALRAVLNQNSGNSSKPPSSDGYKKIHNSRVKSGKKRGGQLGHKGHMPKFFEKPTKIIEIKAQKCKCGGKVNYSDSRYVKKQLVDIEIKANITEYREYTGKCECCGSRVQNRSPVNDSVTYGNHVKSLINMLSIEGNVSINRIGQMISEITDGLIKLSDGTISKWNRDLSKLVAPSVQKIKEKLLISDVLHKDETGIWVETKLRWFHVLSNADYSLFYAHGKRGRDADIEAAVLPAFKGVLVHDHLRSLYHFNCAHAECNAHILRYLKGAVENKKRRWAEEMIAFFMKAKSAVKEKPPDSEEIQDFHRRYDEILDNGEFETQQNENPDYKGADLTLLRRLREYKMQHLRFLSDRNVPFDNNQAERDLRMIKAKTKISGCFRSDDGDGVFAALKTYTATLRKKSFNIFAGLISAWRGIPVLF